MGQSVRIWQKNKLRLDLLNIREREMYYLGEVGMFSVVDRLRQGKGPSDGPAKPLAIPYARYKSRKGKGNKRDLFFTGQMLAGVKVRTVSGNRVYIAPDARQRTESRAARKKSRAIAAVTNRIVAMANQKREPWLVFSPVNRRAVIDKLRMIVAQRRLIASRSAGKP